MSGARTKKKQRRRARASTSRSAGARGAAPAARAGRADGGAGAAARADEARARPSRFEVRDGVARPQPPWAPFPLSEIGMAAGIAILVAGFASDGRRATWLMSVAVLLLAVVVVELCVREHVAGFRSHTLLLAVLPVAVLDGVLVLAFGDALRGPVVLVAALALAGALGWWLHARFRAAHERARTP